jgi:hypothetical protein
MLPKCARIGKVNLGILRAADLYPKGLQPIVAANTLILRDA